jgi:hypothetical protein
MRWARVGVVVCSLAVVFGSGCGDAGPETAPEASHEADPPRRLGGPGASGDGTPLGGSAEAAVLDDAADEPADEPAPWEGGGDETPTATPWAADEGDAASDADDPSGEVWPDAPDDDLPADADEPHADEPHADEASEDDGSGWDAEPGEPVEPVAATEIYDANDRFVAAFCGCYVGPLYGGDMAACERDQPDRGDLAPNACDNATFAADPPEGDRFLGCIAGAIDDFRLCFAGCPPPGGFDFDICFQLLEAGYARCFSQTPAGMRDRLLACQ